MKITKRRLRRIIKEEVSNDLRETLMANLKYWRIGVEPIGTDEIYIMTGEAEGITVKVLRRGR